MPAGQIECVIRHLGKSSRQKEAADVGDAELVERFIARRDEAAFELLIRRHGPMVLGVCRRVLRNEMDAEDAFQATFLVLVRKAASIVPRQLVGNWLHGVAHKTALKAKAMSKRRRDKEREAGSAKASHFSEPMREPLLEILDSELSALPEKYRAPILLCDLEGLSYRQAAARLGCLQGTLSGRLSRGRALLARRLTRHCPTLTALGLATLLACQAAASVPPSLTASTFRGAATLLAAGTSAAECVASSKVAALTEGVLKMFLLSKLKIAVSCFLLIAASIAATWTCAAYVSAQAAGPETERETHPAAGKSRPVNSPADSREAEFVFRGAEWGRKTLSLVVVGTTAPVLSLPVKEDLRVFVENRRVGIDALRVGDHVAIRLDQTNRVVQDIRVLAVPDKAPPLKNTSNLSQLDPPSSEEVLHALRRDPRSDRKDLKLSREDIKLGTELVEFKADPPRIFPLVGQAALHHSHWKCTVNFNEIVESSGPFPMRTKRPRVEVVYIEKNYLVWPK